MGMAPAGTRTGTGTVSGVQGALGPGAVLSREVLENRSQLSALYLESLPAPLKRYRVFRR